MNTRSLHELSLPIILGGVCFYIFICFIGVNSFFLVDIGFHNWVKTFNELIGASKELRKIIYWSLILTNDLFIQYFICCVFLYWFSVKLKKRIFLSISMLLFGVILTDLLLFLDRFNDESLSYLVFPPIFSYSHFFENTIVSYIYNSIVWVAIMAFALYTTSKLKMKQNNKNIKDTTNCSTGPANSAGQ